MYMHAMQDLDSVSSSQRMDDAEKSETRSKIMRHLCQALGFVKQFDPGNVSAELQDIINVQRVMSRVGIEIGEDDS